MLSIHRPETDLATKQVKLNILPCEISYTGKTSASRRYWNVQPEKITGDNGQEKDVQVSYFRGRKLLGRTARIPDGYRGVIVSSDKTPVVHEELAQPQESVFSRIARRNLDDEDEEDDEHDDDGMDLDLETQTPLETMDEIAQFEDITVWDHEVEPNPEEPFIRGVEEWLNFAKVVHSSDDQKL